VRTAVVTLVVRNSSRAHGDEVSWWSIDRSGRIFGVRHAGGSAGVSRPFASTAGGCGRVADGLQPVAVVEPHGLDLFEQ
jgi:hypothetical protein